MKVVIDKTAVGLDREFVAGDLLIAKEDDCIVLVTKDVDGQSTFDGVMLYEDDDFYGAVHHDTCWTTSEFTLFTGKLTISN